MGTLKKPKTELEKILAGNGVLIPIQLTKTHPYPKFNPKGYSTKLK